ncbi:variable large family protein [Borreliella afzelii]|uniref:variable large family protein n=1 Tax=Borreliella afzelii TaxID=29518 RepID=UPI003AF67D75
MVVKRVSAVSGEQIIKAIVAAAGKDDKGQVGKKASDAANPIQAAIGKANEEDAKAFGKDGMKKDDQIAAAIALRGMAKDGKFAVKNDNEKDAKGAVKSAAESVAELIEKLIIAAKEVGGCRYWY